MLLFLNISSKSLYPGYNKLQIHDSYRLIVIKGAKKLINVKYAK